MIDDVNLDKLHGIALGAAGQFYAPVSPLELFDVVMYARTKEQEVALAKEITAEHKAAADDARREMRDWRSRAIDEINERITMVQLEDVIRAAIAAPDHAAALAILRAALAAPYPRTT